MEGNKNFRACVPIGLRGGAAARALLRLAGKAAPGCEASPDWPAPRRSGEARARARASGRSVSQSVSQSVGPSVRAMNCLTVPGVHPGSPSRPRGQIQVPGRAGRPGAAASAVGPAPSGAARAPGLCGEMAWPGWCGSWGRASPGRGAVAPRAVAGLSRRQAGCRTGLGWAGQGGGRASAPELPAWCPCPAVFSPADPRGSAPR